MPIVKGFDCLEAQVRVSQAGDRIFKRKKINEVYLVHEVSRNSLRAENCKFCGAQ